MSPLSFLLNTLWLIFGGLPAAIAWLIAVQLLDRGGVVAEFAQHLVGVLALVRGRAQPLGLREGAHMDRLADDVEGADFWVIDRPPDAEMLDLRVGEDLVDRVDRPARHA